jgi:hypothetical protein
MNVILVGIVLLPTFVVDADGNVAVVAVALAFVAVDGMIPPPCILQTSLRAVSYRMTGGSPIVIVVVVVVV